MILRLRQTYQKKINKNLIHKVKVKVKTKQIQNKSLFKMKKKKTFKLTTITNMRKSMTTKKIKK